VKYELTTKELAHVTFWQVIDTELNREVATYPNNVKAARLHAVKLNLLAIKVMMARFK
jgi:hypothetical protein